MKHCLSPRRLLLTLPLLVLASPGLAQIYRCEIDGEIVFSQIPCEENAEEVQIRDETQGLGADPGTVHRMQQKTDRYLRHQNIRQQIAREREESAEKIATYRQERAECQQLPRTRRNPVQWQQAVADCVARYDRLIEDQQARSEQRVRELAAKSPQR